GGPPAPGVTARGGAVADLADHAPLPGVSYVEVACGSEDAWEDEGRDAVITAIREMDRPHAVGIAARTPDPLVLEDVAVLARTFGLRLLVDLGLHSPAVLDEAGILGPHCHATCARPLDPGERKLLRLRRTSVAVCPSPSRPDDLLALLDEGNDVALCTRCPTPDADLLRQARDIRERARAVGLRTRGLDRKLVEAATLGGAQALGMRRGTGRIGSLGPGSRADFAVFDARGRYPYSALLARPSCLATVVGGRVRPQLPT
uniref:amidohydrolase family protein n=1 Tax=Nonomuraea lactucae TaxID=2249762 RepID=UPI0013B4227C